MLVASFMRFAATSIIAFPGRESGRLVAKPGIAGVIAVG